jgi:6-phosphogluconolactonase
MTYAFLFLKRAVLLAAFAAVTVSICAADMARDAYVYIGTYTGQKSKGIYAFHMNLETGELHPVGLVGEISSPSFLAIHPSRRFLYAVNEVDKFEGKNSGAVTGFAIDSASGKLTTLNSKGSGGSGPCYVSIDKAGKFALVANYGSGSVESLPIEANGNLGEPVSIIQHKGSSVDKSRQEGPHAHSINLDAQNHFAIAADLGLDELIVYKFDQKTGALSPNDPPFASIKPGSGPRHFAFHPNGKFAYSNNEMLSSVTRLTWDAKRGILKPVDYISTLPTDFTGKDNSTAEVQVHRSGKFVYCSNRGHNSIAIFSVDQATGKLSHVANESTQGKTPRNFGIDPTGKFLIAANQDSDSLVVFKINQETGALQPTGAKLDAPSPVCVKFLTIK